MGVQTVETDDIDSLGARLAADGVVAVEDYLDEETCDSYRERVETALENDEFDFANESTSASEMMSASSTMVNRRSGEDDDGMLDIFNIDQTIPEIREIKTDPFVSDIIAKAGGTNCEPENINIYVNRSVTETRGYHFDSYNDQYKAFVYLTDVLDESYGPYSYIKGSNGRSYVRRRLEGLLNRALGNRPTAAISYDDDDIVTFTAQKGTLIISDQTGYHRGIPQADGRERMLISNSHTPK